jgi:hypothetical protein
MLGYAFVALALGGLVIALSSPATAIPMIIGNILL